MYIFEEVLGISDFFRSSSSFHVDLSSFASNFQHDLRRPQKLDYGRTTVFGIVVYGTGSKPNERPNDDSSETTKKMHGKKYRNSFTFVQSGERGDGGLLVGCYDSRTRSIEIRLPLYLSVGDKKTFPRLNKSLGQQTCYPWYLSVGATTQGFLRLAKLRREPAVRKLSAPARQMGT